MIDVLLMNNIPNEKYFLKQNFHNFKKWRDFHYIIIVVVLKVLGIESEGRQWSFARHGLVGVNILLFYFAIFFFCKGWKSVLVVKYRDLLILVLQEGDSATLHNSVVFILYCDFVSISFWASLLIRLLLHVGLLIILNGLVLFSQNKTSLML